MYHTYQQSSWVAIFFGFEMFCFIEIRFLEIKFCLVAGSRIVEVTDEEAEKFMKNDKKDIKNSVEKEIVTSEKSVKESGDADKDDEDPEDKGKLKPNSGNGCDLPHGRYSYNRNVFNIASNTYVL